MGIDVSMKTLPGHASCATRPRSIVLKCIGSVSWSGKMRTMPALLVMWIDCVLQLMVSFQNTNRFEDLIYVSA